MPCGEKLEIPVRIRLGIARRELKLRWMEVIAGTGSVTGARPDPSRRPEPDSPGSVHQEHWDGGVAQDGASHAAEHHLPEPAVSVGAHDQEVGLGLGGLLE